MIVQYAVAAGGHRAGCGAAACRTITVIGTVVAELSEISDAVPADSGAAGSAAVTGTGLLGEWFVGVTIITFLARIDVAIAAIRGSGG